MAGSASIGGVNVKIQRVSGESGSYAIELMATAEGQDVPALIAAGHCTLITPSGQTVKASYVRIGDESGRSGRGTLLAGYEIPLEVRWSLDNPRLTKLLRVQLKLNLSRKWHTLKFDELTVQ